MASPSLFQTLKSKTIGEVINPRLIQTTPDTTLGAAVQLMRKEESAYLVVARKEKIHGLFTETDLVRKVLGAHVDWKRPLKDFMTEPVITLHPEDTVEKAINLMAEHNFYHIPLVDKGGKLVGILSVRTLIRFLAEFYPAEVYNLPPDLHQVMATEEGG